VCFLEGMHILLLRRYPLTRTLPVKILNRDSIGEEMTFKKQKTETMPQLSLGSSSGLSSVKLEVSEEAQKKTLDSQDTHSS
jgi:hypothetical protein